MDWRRVVTRAYKGGRGGVDLIGCSEALGGGRKGERGYEATRVLREMEHGAR